MPALTTETLRRYVGLLKLSERRGVHKARWMAPRAIRREVSVPLVIQDGFGHDRSRRIAGTQKQNVEVLWYRLHADLLRHAGA